MPGIRCDLTGIPGRSVVFSDEGFLRNRVVIPKGMGDSQTDARTDTVIEASAEIAALREQLTLARDRLAERDRQLAEQDRQQAELDQQQAELDRQLPNRTGRL